jgi:hypothetical protein
MVTAAPEAAAMTSTTPIRILGIALATLALAAPAAGAMPIGDDSAPAAPKQDLRNPDQRAPAPRPYQDLRNPDQQAPTPPIAQTPFTPVELTKPAPIAADSGLSPLVIVVPSLVLVAMLAASVIYTRSSRPARV